MSRRASRHDLAAARKELPIYTYRDELVEAIQNYQCLIVVGDTGSGKTTQLPQYILESLPAFKSICITQPRRIAAISSARRVAEERGSRLGQEVGYSIRFERSASNSTKLLYVTDGTLLRTVATDPTIKEYDMVMLDEAHERSLETDVLFGLLRRACRLRPELKVVVMSATLDIEKFSEFFGDAPVFSIPGRMYAVDIMWQKKMKLGTAKATFVRRSVDTVLHIHKNEEPGDVLIFLTGQQEIEMTTRLLMEAHEELDYGEVRHRNTVKDMVIYPIYSALETLEQRSIFDSPPEGVRKIVIATNIAQTSVTIPGIRYVVDSGFVKQKMYDPRTGVDALIVVPISQAAATQRAGRAGRTASGKVYRLYSREAFEDMEPATVPEIQRSSLIGTVLALKKMGIDDIMNFEFIDPPDPELVIGATKQLFLLGAVDEHGHLTSLGRQMSEFPISPYLSRVLISAAIDFNCSYEVLIITSMLSVEEIFSTPRSKKKQEAAEQLRSRFNDPSGDHLGLLRIYQEWRDFDYSKDWAYDMYIHYRALSAARKVKDQLSEIMERLGLPITSCESRDNADQPRKRARRQPVEEDSRWPPARERNVDKQAVLRSFCTAFYVHTAKRHPQRSHYYPYVASINNSLQVTNQRAQDSNQGSGSQHLMALCLHPQSSLSADDAKTAEWVIYNDVQYVNRATMRICSRVKFEWVDVLLGRLKLVDEEKLAGRVPNADGSHMGDRRPSILELATEDEPGFSNQNSDTEGTPKVEKPEFELVHEVIDEMHGGEHAIGEDIGSSKIADPKSDNHHPSTHPASTDAAGLITMPTHAPHPSDHVADRENMVSAARERYLKRKGRR